MRFNRLKKQVIKSRRQKSKNQKNDTLILKDNRKVKMREHEKC